MGRYISPDHIVQTACGPVQGLAGSDGITEFRGIRYATAKRFARPEPVTRWDDLYNATQFGNACHQPREFFPEDPFYAKEFRQGMTYTYDEDCLFLNIWVPADAENAPVAFYIHGGGLTSCCGNEKKFEPSAWCRKGVIAVTINYRLGVFGFSNFEAARTEDTCGNYGLFDQLAALTWVKDHIASFGGDPNRITILGQSAGAMSVQQMVLSPLSAGLFQGAVMFSGGGLLTALGPQRAEETFAQWNAFAESLGAHTLEELRAIPAEELLKAHCSLPQDKKPATRLVIDGMYIPKAPAKTAETDGAHPVPYILTYTRNDIFPTRLHAAVDEWATVQQAQNAPPVYSYFFDHALPGDDAGAWHSCDLWYIFGSQHRAWRPWEEWDRTLSDAIVSYLCDFFHTGDPNAGGTQPPWLPTTPEDPRRLCLTDTGIAMNCVDPTTLA